MVDRTSGELEPADENTGPGIPAAQLRQLVSNHYQSLYRYAYRLSGKEADAEDLTQQTYLIAQSKLHQLREADKADRWLFAILRSCFLKGVNRNRAIDVDSMDGFVEDTGETRRQQQALDREELQQALDDLLPEYRVIVLMYYFEELSYKEIAEQLEIPMGTVMSRLARAKMRLRERMLVEEGAPRPPASRHRVPTL
jgi:RNA polymerase sigma-70 factor (ECF subfamily)